VKELLSVAIGGSQRFGSWMLDAVGQRNDNRLDEPNDYWEFQSGTTTFGPDTFRVQDDGTVAITSTGRNRQDPSFQNFRRVRFHEQLTQEDSYIGTADARRDFVLNRSVPGFIKFGAKFTRTSRETDIAEPTYNVGSQVWTAAQVTSATAGAFQNPIPLRAMPNLWLDIDDLSAFFGTNGNDPRYFAYDAANSFLTEHQSDFSLRERVVAAYAMSKIGFGRLSLVGGLRVESTKVDSTANTIVTQNGQRTARPIDGGGSYVNLLPSLVGTLGLRSNLVARAAFTTAVGRPEFDVLAPRSQLGIEDNPAIGTVGTLTIGNPDLKARHSNNVDLSLEWYFSEGAIASVAFFNKSISNEIIPAPTDRRTNYVFEGQRFDRFDLNTTVNAEDAFVRGVELTLAHQLRFLPAPFNGLGFGGSLTLLDSGVDVERDAQVLTLPLLEQADRSTSLTLYYQKGRWDVSGTYKYNANFWTDYGASRSLDLDQGSFARFDCRLQFDLTRDIKLNFSGINLNDEPTSEFQGGNRSWNTEYEYTGRTFLLGISARLGR
ncbi:MAG: TonB-dependent receptor, partial [Vicinamibacterales bacterium]